MLDRNTKKKTFKINLCALAREAGRLPADLQLFLSASQTNPQTYKTAAYRLPTAASLPSFPVDPKDLSKHPYSRSLLDPNSSRHSLLTHSHSNWQSRCPNFGSSPLISPPSKIPQSHSQLWSWTCSSLSPFFASIPRGLIGSW